MGLFREVKCGRCDRRYSSIRSRCPYCGARKNRGGKRAAENGNKQWQLIAGILILIAIVVAVIILVSSSLKNKEDPEATVPITPSEETGLIEVTASPIVTQTPTNTVAPTPTPTPEPTVTAITLNRTDFTLSFIGEQWTMTATLSPASSNAEVKWSVEDENVAIINQSGVVTAIDRGWTNIICEAGGMTAKCIVRVTADSILGDDEENQGGESTVSLSHVDVTIKAANSESFQLTVRGTSATPTYSSDKTGVATVSSDGTVKAVSTGTATISVTVNGVTMTCIVRVV
jgi:uncharacterized protein YjdB